MTSELARKEAPGTPAPAASPGAGKAPAPPRPSLTGKPAPPVIVRRPPPFTIGIAMVSWVSSLIAGAAAVVYLMVIRTGQLPKIADKIEGVVGGRAADTYESAADIVFWCMFGILVGALLLQTTFVVAFANRRPRMRWWMFGSLILVVLVLLLGRELVTMGDRGTPVELLLLAEAGLLALGLLASILPWSLRWSARRHDVERGVHAGVGGEL